MSVMPENVPAPIEVRLSQLEICSVSQLSPVVSDSKGECEMLSSRQDPSHTSKGAYSPIIVIEARAWCHMVSERFHSGAIGCYIPDSSDVMPSQFEMLTVPVTVTSSRLTDVMVVDCTDL